MVLLADHGEEFLDHGGYLHGFTLYRELIRVPLIVRLPGGRGGARRVAQVVGLIDVGPTLLDLAGVRDDRAVQGSSLAGPIRGAGEAWTARPGLAYSELDREPLLESQLRRDRVHRAAVTAQRWTFLAGVASGAELYDLGSDALQRFDRAASDPAAAGVMRRHLERHLAERPRKRAAERVPLGEPEKQSLRALGYLD